jgi:hypothetical protein
MDSLFGMEITGAARFIIAFVVVLALIAVTAWLVRRFGSGSLSAGGARGRQPRLAVVDGASVDARRKLILVRRDNVEHLVMIGGPTDVLIEANIVRAAATGREAAARATPIPETMPRPMPLEEEPMWQPEPTLAPRPPRPAPSAAAPSSPPVAPPIAAEWSNAAHQQMDVSVRTHHPDTLAELAEALAAQAPLRAEPQAPPRAPAAGQYATPASDPHLADMAHRLDAALRRPPGSEPRLDVPEAPPVGPAVPPHALDAETAAEHRAPEVRPVTPEPPPNSESKRFYETLEQEMASLLGRPTGKT